MRLTFWFLLLVNLLLLLWGLGFSTAQRQGSEPERLKRQIEPDKLRILKNEVRTARPAPDGAVKALACRRIEGLSAAEGTALHSAAAAETGWEVSELTPFDEAPSHWVLVPDLASRTLAVQKKEELGRLGIRDSEIVKTAVHGPFAVSLGLFRSQQLAEEFLQALTKKGVRSARLVQRQFHPTRFALELRAPQEELEHKLPGLLPAQAQVKVLDCGVP